MLIKTDHCRKMNTWAYICALSTPKMTKTECFSLAHVLVDNIQRDNFMGCTSAHYKTPGGDRDALVLVMGSMV